MEYRWKAMLFITGKEEDEDSVSPLDLLPRI